MTFLKLFGKNTIVIVLIEKQDLTTFNRKKKVNLNIIVIIFGFLIYI